MVSAGLPTAACLPAAPVVRNQVGLHPHITSTSMPSRSGSSNTLISSVKQS